MNGRAVSHMVGFILIFGVIMTGATFTLVVGQGAITDMSGFEQDNNAERAMTLLGQDIDHLAYSRSATSETAMNLGNGQIRHENASNVTVTVTNATRGETTTLTIPTGSIVNDRDETLLRYENGMVTGSQRGNARPLTDPEISCTDNRAIVSIVTLQGNEDRQIGSGRVTIDAFLNESRVVYPINRAGATSAHDADRVSLDINSSVDGAWSQYFDQTNWDSPGNYECVVDNSGEVIVRQVIIDVEFQR